LAAAALLETTQRQAAAIQFSQVLHQLAAVGAVLLLVETLAVQAVVVV
jgi:hypothetical protein